MDAPVLHVEARGSGPVLLLAHGLGGSARNFRPQVRALADAFRVVTFDLRGHARSEAPADAGAYTLEALARDLGRVLDDQGVARAAVGGLSLGAAAALAFARTRPERVRGLVLASYPARGGFGRVARAFADAIEREGLAAAGARYVWGEDSGLDPVAAGLVRQGFLEHPPAAIAHLLRGVVAELPDPARLAPRLADLRVPTLLVAGALDAASVGASRTLAAALPDARLEVIPDAGHVVNLAAPAAFDAALRAFLETLAPDASGAPPVGAAEERSS